MGNWVDTQSSKSDCFEFCSKSSTASTEMGDEVFLGDAELESDILGWHYVSGSLPDVHELERLDSPEENVGIPMIIRAFEI